MSTLTRVERMAVIATGVLVLSVPVTIHMTQAPTPTQSAPTVVTLSRADLTDMCGQPSTACYAPHRDPNAVYVSEDTTRPDVLAYVIAHETVHFEQHRDGRPFDECEADRIAMERTPQYSGNGAYADTCN